MRLRHLLIAASLTLTLGGAASAAPIPAQVDGLNLAAVDTTLVKWKGHGHAYGHRKWHRDRGLHRGWYKHRRRYRS